MVTLDLETLALILGILGTIGGIILAFFRFYRRFEKLEEKGRQDDTLLKALCRGVFACLDGLHQMGCNGEVSKAIELLRDKIINE